MLRAALILERLLGIDKDLCILVESGLGPGVEGRLRRAPDRMGNDDDAGVREAQRAGHLVREGRELPAGDRDGRPAPFFEGTRVVETPRRAAASIGGAREDDLHFRGESFEEIGLARRGGGLLLNHACERGAGP